MDTKKNASNLFKVVLQSVDPRKFLPEKVLFDKKNDLLTIENYAIQLKKNQPVYLIGTGKASPTMASAVEKILGERLHSGVIIAPPDSEAELKTVEMLIGSHPLPDHRSFSSSAALLNFITSIPEGALVLNLVSGGTSALFAVPQDGISEDHLNRVYGLLLKSGASIQEINTVRRALSKVKGGQLLTYLNHTILMDIIISDVPDDDLRFIGSGPTIPQVISFQDALSIIREYSLDDAIPKAVRAWLEEQIVKNPDYQTKDNDSHRSFVVSSASIVAAKFAELVHKEGYNVHLVEPAWAGLIDDFEEHICSYLTNVLEQKNTREAYIFFGECTVEVTGSGLGGRNQELALRMTKRLDGVKRNVTFLSAGTDGIDGPTDAAGAVVDEKSYRNALKNGIDPENYLQENNSYPFFKESEGHILTGPTGNNVMDLQLLLID
ncbi:MAG: DUF4147 domain-containing protein [Balneolaceae bacterium]|nr:MAG: DUF4147 domain-containing protein [Balneolaceae bacterium]